MKMEAYDLASDSSADNWFEDLEDKLRNQYKWCMTLCQYQQKAIVAIWWDYSLLS